MAWSPKLDGIQQRDIIVTRDAEPEITIANLAMAEFVYLLLQNEKIREVINTITATAVLILGRFTSERKALLDAIRKELRHRDYGSSRAQARAVLGREFPLSTLSMCGVGS